MYSNIGTPNNHNFPFGTNEKIVVLGVPILKHFRGFASIVSVGSALVAISCLLRVDTNLGGFSLQWRQTGSQQKLSPTEKVIEKSGEVSMYLSIHRNPIALRLAETLWSFGHFECNRVKVYGYTAMSWVPLLQRGGGGDANLIVE